MKRLLICSILVLVMFTAAARAQGPFVVQGAFDDTGTFSGMFNYDVSTKVYSGISFVSTTGTTRAGATYLFVCGAPDIPGCGDGFSPTPSSVAFQTTNGADQTGLPSLFMNFSVPLNQVLFSSTFALRTGDHLSDEGTCGNASCTVDPNTRFTISGTVTTESMPLFEYLYFGS